MITRLFIISRFLLVLLFVSGCSESSLQMTDQFVEVNKPGQGFGIIEVKALSIDSVFGYPSEIIEVKAITLIDRRTKKMIGENSYAKVFFGKKNRRYHWRTRNNVVKVDYVDSDTIALKAKTWYRVSKERGTYGTEYFYWEGTRNDFKTFVVPDPGGW